MKNLIVQVFFDRSLISDSAKLKDDGTRGSMLTAKNLNMELYGHSHILARRYSKRIGADYILFDQPYVNFLNPMFERFRIFLEEKWENGSRVRGKWGRTLSGGPICLICG